MPTMTSYATPTAHASNLVPALTTATLVTSLVAGGAADLTWEAGARVITPLIPGVGGRLEPAAGRLVLSRSALSRRPAEPEIRGA